MSNNPARTPIEEQAKAVVGALLAGLTALGTALASGGVTAAEWVGVAVAVVAAYGTVFGVRNGPAGRRRRRTPEGPTHGLGSGERGQVERALLIAVLVVALIVLLSFLL